MTARLNHTIVAVRDKDASALYFDDPNGHLLEIITKPYGSAGTEAQHPHPLIASKIERTDRERT